MNDMNTINHNGTAMRLDSPEWVWFVKACFAVSVGAMLVGIFFMPAVLWIKGYLVMGTLFIVGSSLTLSKTVRDQFESSKLINKMAEARTERMLKEYEAQQ